MMKYKMCVMCAVLAMSGCSTQRNVTTESHVKTELEGTIKDSIVRNSTEELTRKLHGKEKIHIVWYDELCETPEVTEGRPVKAEAWIEREEDTEAVKASEEHVETAHKVDQSISHEQDERRKEKEEYKSEVTGMSGWWWMLMAGVIIGMAAEWRMMRKE